jgi:hypothetical protein
MIRVSLTTCKALAAPDRLSAYTTGACRHGQPESQARLSLADRIMRVMPLPRIGQASALPANDNVVNDKAGVANDNAALSDSPRNDGLDRVASGL